MAIALVRHSFRGRTAANLLIVIPMATPEVVIGASLLSMFIYYTFALGFTTLLIAHVMFSISFVVVVVRSRLIGFDRHLEEAAADLGATPLATFRNVTLPLLAPGILAAALLAFSLSIDDFVISNFNSGTTVTFPLYVYGVSLRGSRSRSTCWRRCSSPCSRRGRLSLAAAPRRTDGRVGPSRCPTASEGDGVRRVSRERVPSPADVGQSGRQVECRPFARRRSGPAQPAGRRSSRWPRAAAARRAARGPRDDRSRQPPHRPALRLGRRPPRAGPARATTAPAPSATRCTAPGCSTTRWSPGTIAEYWGEGGVGRWITVYANRQHVYMVVAGLRFDTRDGLTARTGPRWHTECRATRPASSPPATRPGL